MKNKKKPNKKIPFTGNQQNNNQAKPTIPASSSPPALIEFSIPNPVTDDLRCAEGEPLAFLSDIVESQLGADPV